MFGVALAPIGGMGRRGGTTGATELNAGRSGSIKMGATENGVTAPSTSTAMAGIFSISIGFSDLVTAVSCCIGVSWAALASLDA